MDELLIVLDDAYVFVGITLLITHYNRSGSLERLLAAFKKLNCRFDNIVVSDDASKSEHLDKVKALQLIYNFQLVTTPVNKGHGHSMNKGQDIITSPYTLYVQEDFVPSSIFAMHLKDALQFMQEDKNLDYIRFWALANKYPILRPYGKGFSEMVFNFLNRDHLKFYQYSDTPHLRRRSFFDKFGRYKEGLKGDVIDYLMAISFLRYKGKGLFFDNYSALFSHENSHDEPSTMRPLVNWRQKHNFFILFMRFVYLQYKWLKGTWLVLFFKKD